MPSNTDRHHPARPGAARDLPAPPELLAAPGYVARRLYQAYVAAWVRVVDAKLTGPQFAVLTAVRAHPGVDQGSLAASVALDRSTMADIVRRLEERGYITRRADANDGRRKLLNLSEDGAATLDQAEQRVRALDRQLLKGYTTAQQARLIDELNAMSDHWEALTRD